MSPILREASEVWSRLFLYENRDQTSRLFHEKHGREVSAQKAREINSAFAQGREYFEAASTAGELVSPLLQYYGVLALSRGTILFALPEARERSLSQRHGVQIVGWDGIGSAETSRLDDLRLKSTAGTFEELAAATKNREHLWIDTEEPGQVLLDPFLVVKPHEVPTNGSEWQIRDVVRRIPALSDLYEELFDKNAACYGVNARLKVDGKTAEVMLYSVRDDQESLQGLMKTLRFEANAHAKEFADRMYFGSYPRFRVEVVGRDRESLVNSLPLMQRVPGTIGMGERTYMIEPFPSGLVLSPLLTLFGLSYFLGMLVRYHPSVWRTMLNRDKGDLLYPLFRLASTVIRADYPRFILEELEN